MGGCANGDGTAQDGGVVSSRIVYFSRDNPRGGGSFLNVEWPQGKFKNVVMVGFVLGGRRINCSRYWSSSDGRTIYSADGKIIKKDPKTNVEGCSLGGGFSGTSIAPGSWEVVLCDRLHDSQGLNAVPYGTPTGSFNSSPIPVEGVSSVCTNYTVTAAPEYPGDTRTKTSISAATPLFTTPVEIAPPARTGALVQIF
jgi:hypothetical protein